MKLLLLICTTLFSAISFAQNVGIGTPSPAFPLDINGRARIRYNGGTAGIWFNKQDNSSPASFVGHINDTTFGIFDNASNAWQFAFNHSKTNMGIGTLTPKFPLTFADAIGNKISLFGGSTSTTTPHYGLGIQSGLMQFYTDNSGADFAFGYGNSNAFTENMRIKGDGNINIGGPIWASAANDRVIRFGDGDFVHIGEAGADDKMELKAGSFLFKNGKVQIQDGTQGVGKAFVSDANGVGTWSAQAFTNVERFKVTGNGKITIAGFSVADFNSLTYNYSSNIVIDFANESVTFNKAGLYRLEFAANTGNGTAPQYVAYVYLLIDGVPEFMQSVLINNFNTTAYSDGFQFTTDRYLPAGTVVKVRYFTNLSIGENYFSGHLIAE